MSAESSEPNVKKAPYAARAAAIAREYLTPEEIRELQQVEDWRGGLTLAVNWGLVAAAFALVAWAPNPLTIVVALVLIGTRQLGCAVVMHEAAHRALFSNRKLNDWAGNWLAAYPVWAEVEPYRRYHLVHHRNTGGPGDPDLSLVAPFPITRRSLWRKVWRDLSGQTGWKQAKAVARRDLGLRKDGGQRVRGAAEGEAPDVGLHKLVPVVASNAVIFGLLALFGHPALYALWVVAWLTTYRLATRLRSIAEHAMGGDPDDPLQNTRTVIANWLERLLIAPNRVNFHLEHHLLMTVPLSKLPRMHELLRQRGALDAALVTRGYLGVFANASSKPAESAAAA